MIINIIFSFGELSIVIYMWVILGSRLESFRFNSKWDFDDYILVFLILGKNINLEVKNVGFDFY